MNSSPAKNAGQIRFDAGRLLKLVNRNTRAKKVAEAIIRVLPKLTEESPACRVKIITPGGQIKAVQGDQLIIAGTCVVNVAKQALNARFQYYQGQRWISHGARFLTRKLVLREILRQHHKEPAIEVVGVSPPGDSRARR